MIELHLKPSPKHYSVTLRPHFESEAMFHLGEITLLILASLWLVEGQPGTVRTTEYDVLRNNSGRYYLYCELLGLPTGNVIFYRSTFLISLPLSIFKYI